MSLTRRQFLATGLGAGALALAGGHIAKQSVRRERWYLFGTLVEVSVVGGDEHVVERSLAELSLRFQAMNRDWHPWLPGQMGDINNAIGRGESIPIDVDMIRMVDQIQQLHRASNGTFNPAIGKIVSSWGFLGGSAEGWTPPDGEAIDQLLAAHPSPLDLTITNGELASTNPAVQLDLGGYAKGYALNLGMTLLRSAGLEHAVINAGGDLLAMGEHDDRPWRIAIRHPRRRQDVLAWLETSGAEAVFTSGNYERYREYQGQRYPHILDPRRGRPVNEIASATVVHSDGAIADAAATALVVAGKAQWRRIARDMGIRQAMVVDEHGEVAMTPAIAERLSFV